MAACSAWRYDQSMLQVTQVLMAIESGDPKSAAELLPLVYEELRRLAASKLAHEKVGQTLQPTALVHEAYLRLIGDGESVSWNGRSHFFGAAAEAMRRILINRARDKNRIKRRGRRTEVDLKHFSEVTSMSADDLIDLDEAVNRLSTSYPQAAELVRLRFYAGLTLAETAATLGVSGRSADRLWVFARSWLIDSLSVQGKEIAD